MTRVLSHVRRTTRLASYRVGQSGLVLVQEKRIVVKDKGDLEVGTDRRDERGREMCKPASSLPPPLTSELCPTRQEGYSLRKTEYWCAHR